VHLNFWATLPVVFCAFSPSLFLVKSAIPRDMLANKTCSGFVGFCGTYGKRFAQGGFKFFLLPIPNSPFAP
jgi:hypothetical protein